MVVVAALAFQERRFLAMGETTDAGGGAASACRRPTRRETPVPPSSPPGIHRTASRPSVVASRNPSDRFASRRIPSSFSSTTVVSRLALDAIPPPLRVNLSAKRGSVRIPALASTTSYPPIRTVGRDTSVRRGAVRHRRDRPTFTAALLRCRWPADEKTSCDWPPKNNSAR